MSMLCFSCWQRVPSGELTFAARPSHVRYHSVSLRVLHPLWLGTKQSDWWTAGDVG